MTSILDQLPEPVRLQFSEEIDLEAWFSESNSHLNLETRVINPKQRLDVYDTFDWRLFKKGHTLVSSGNQLWLSDLTLEARDHQIEYKSVPAFLWDLPSGELRDALSGPVEMRRFLAQARVTRQIDSLAVVNQDRKAVVHVDRESQEFQVGDDDLRVFELVLRPIRGYLAEWKEVLEAFGELNLATTKKQNVYAAAGIKAGNYNAKPKVNLDPEQEASDAGKRIFKPLLKIMKRNIDGIRQDIDSEYLHDFRVAIRRTRSGLSQIKNIFEPTVTEKAKQDFTTIGKWTNHLRDLDVYLLKKDEYHAMLPEDLRPHLDVFFEDLEADREQELKKVSGLLVSDELERVFGWWGDFLKQPTPDTSQALHAHTAIKEVADNAILKKYKKVRRAHQVLTPETPDQPYHDLRIECKKLRYLLEFFSSLYDKQMISDLVGRLKKLQNGLGDFNDFSVQQDYLKQYAATAKLKSHKVRQTVMAVGVLVGMLHERQGRLKVVCLEGLDQFTDADTRAIVRSCFKGGRS